MTRAEQARTAATDIDWCCQPPHTIDQCIGHAVEQAGKLAEERRHDARPVGGHADPTAAGVHEQREPEEVSRTRSRALMLWDLARSVDTLARTLNPHAPPMRERPKVLAVMLRDATIPLHAHALVLDDIETQGDEDIDWLLRQLAESAAWLRAKCEGIYAEHRGARVAEQKPMRWCVSCARAGLDVSIDVDRYADACRGCGDYRAANGRKWPPVEWVRFRGERGRWPSTVDARRPAATVTRHAAG